MKTPRLIIASLAFGALATLAWAQDSTDPYANVPASEYGPRAGSREITLGGNGVSDKDMDDSWGGVSGSFGIYLNDTLEALVRQSVNYANPDGAGTSWNGSTFLALDQHFAARGALRPFVGVNAGRIYGDALEDTWAAGLEGGVKFYVQPRTFVVALVQYAWYFDDGEQIDNTFSDGQFIWNVGLGFNF